MAQKVNIVLVDDIDETEADETVSFGLDGKEYAIDLNTDNATKLREALAPYVAHARPVSGRGGRRSSGGSSRAASTSSGPAPAEIRAWARENGFDVPERGRVSAEVRDAYAAAH
ncbi:histone-like nucleoid-structuring protein Lsr2 [Nocardioides aurantiacus]|uniref:Lsr2 protein n=1 Tax=Nocardioides aurantiacus TaxID=86796 RepID=A0A3N2CPN1_9ACTN|nr:Lsr2 family protein [Nocardioides aurantiacus]ROR89462.1 Lsr2 protein [Nocardioides aurantiacus]